VQSLISFFRSFLDAVPSHDITFTYQEIVVTHTYDEVIIRKLPSEQTEIRNALLKDIE